VKLEVPGRCFLGFGVVEQEVQQVEYEDHLLEEGVLAPFGRRQRRSRGGEAGWRPCFNGARRPSSLALHDAPPPLFACPHAKPLAWVLAVEARVGRSFS